MAKGLNKVQIGLEFTADTKQAKRELNDLKNSLNEVIKLPGKASSLFDDSSIREASKSAQLLQNHLQAAVNVDTGKLDLSKFSMSLKASNQSLNEHIGKILQVGPAGQRAFLSLAKSITNAEMPTRRVNKALEEMITTMKNTARWQISSSILHGFMGTVQKAYGYAQDLNESLNDIRIVTGYNTDQMAKFAKEANKAAKALSTTTTEYTNASLIYFQQGLNDQQVKERTDITVKMANVSKQSAEVVSDQMTAVWNNFYDGSKSLEYYADVMTKLGAATASSSDEIAQGLEKFAAIADTVGLSYDYAASALATVTAETRQSADVVGTSFKTIFARIEGLSLGETLDDGTDLNKYSQALATVGVQIKDTNGEIKDMDTILEEMGSRWQTLGQDQKIALAQTVAGVRQYNQLIALMDNWGTFQENLSTAQTSEGALSAQAEIYAQSWEAAQDRVQAALEDVYDSLLNDEFFIELTKGFGGLIETISGLADGLGGLKGVISLIGSIFMAQFADKIPTALLNLKRNLMVTFGQASKEMRKTQQELQDKIKEEKEENPNSTYVVELTNQERASRMKDELLLKSRLLSEEEKVAAENRIKYVDSMGQELLKLHEKLELTKKIKEESTKSAQEAITSEVVNKAEKYSKAEKNVSFQEEKLEKLNQKLNTATDPNSETTFDAKESDDLLKAIQAQEKALEAARIEAAKYEAELTDIQNSFEDKDISNSIGGIIGAKNDDERKSKIKTYKEQTQGTLKEKLDDYSNTIYDRTILDQQTSAFGGQNKEWSKQISNIKNKENKENKSTQKEIASLKKRMNEYINTLKAGIKDVDKFKNEFEDLQDSINNLDFNNFEDSIQQVEHNLSSLEASMDNTVKEMDENIEGQEETLKTMGATPEILKQVSESSTTCANAQDKYAAATENVNKQSQESIESTFKLSEMFGDLGSTAMATSAMIATATNAFSVMGDENATMADKIGAAVSLAAGAYGVFNSAMSLATNLSKSEAIQKGILWVANTVLKKSIDAETVSVWLNNTAWYANPITWIAVAIMAAVAAIVAITAVIIKENKALEENARAELESAKANQELIDSNQELSTSIEDLIEEYNALKESGESTYETMEKLKEQVPELIESYRELENSLAIDLNTGLMEAAARMAEITGNWDEFNRLMDEANEKVEEAEKDSYESGSVSAGQLMADAGRKGSGNVKGATYSNELGGWGSDEKDANEALQEALKEKGIAFDKNGNASTKVELDTTDPTQMVNYYEALAAAKAKLEKEGDTESDTYREISEELKEMSESYEEAKIQADEYLKLVAKDFDKNFNSLAEGNEIFKTASTSFAQYETNLNKMATELATLEGITEEEAKAIIKASDAFKEFAALDDSMDKIIADTGATKEAIGNVYDSLSDEDKTLFLTLDFTEIDKNDLANSIQAALEEAREKAIVAQSKAEAKELGLDESAFEAYTELLQDANDQLKDNAGMASKVALSNARLSKGLVALTDSFKDHVAVLAEGNRQSYEYAEAIGALKDSFEEMFGYKPSSVFIENHLEEIQKLANGDIEVLQELQDSLAEDYVLTMEVGTAINTEFGEGMSTDDVRNELIEMLESIDTSVEVGAGTTISEDYLNSMQAMLDQGQITEEQLTKMLRTKGIEMKVTGHKQVPGPKTTTVQTITSWPGIKRTKTIEEQQMITVPIINGDDSNIYGSEPSGEVKIKTSDGKAVKEPTIDKSKVAQFAKGPDESSISTAAFEDASGKKETEKKIKELEDEKNIYHDTQRELQRLERQYNKINEAKERAYGKQKLAYMEQENEIREAEIAQMEIEIQKANALAETLKNQGAQTYGLSFYNSSGEIANYDEIYEREESYYIKALQSGNEEAIEAAEERWENFKELVSDYEEALDKTAESEEQIAAKQAEIYDTYLEGLEYELEIKLEIDDSKLKILEYQLSKIEDNAFEAATKIDLLGQSTEALLSKGQNYQDSINNLFNKHGLTVEQASGMTDEQLVKKGFTAQELESLRSWQDGLLEVNQALLENKKAVEESVMPAYEAWGEEFDKLTEQVEYATSVLNHYQNVIDLVGRKRLGFDDEFMTSLSRGALNTANDNLKVAKERLAFAEASAAEADDKLKAAKARLAQDPKNEQLQRDVEYWEKIKNELNSDVITQSQAVQSATEASLEAARQSYMVATDAIIEQFNRGLSATGETMDKMMDKYSQSEEKDEWYLEGYEKMYELNKLSRDLDTKLSKATSLQEQESLRKLLEEVNAKKAEGVEMSEHDLAVLKGQVEMEQARLAVEEAREAKTQVIRRRDSEGNYGYIYTADEEASADALQSYEDKVYELMDLNDEYLDDLGMKILEARQMMGEEIAALREEDFASQEEYETAVQAIKDKYTEQINYYTDEMNKALGYNKDIYSQDIINRLAWKGESVQVSQDQLLAMAAIRQEDYANMEEYFAAVAEATGLSVETVKALYHDGTLAQIEEVSAQIGAHEDLQTSFDDTVLSQTTGFTTMQEFNTALTTSTETMVKDLGVAFKTYDEDIQMIIGDYDKFRDTVKTDVSGKGGVVEQSKLAAGSAEDLRKSAEDNFKKATTAVDNWQSNYSTKIDAAIKSNDAYIISLGEVIAKIAEAEGAKSSYENGGTSGGGSGTGGEGGNVSNKDGEIDPESANNSKTGGKTPIYGTYYKSDGTKVRFGGKDIYKDYRGLVNNGNKITAPGTYGSGASAVKVVKDDVVGDLLVESKAYPGNYLRLNDFIITGTTAAIGLGSFYHEPQDQIIGYKTSSFDTGGYTGEWGPEGRLAMLHQKELVLNARDTENMLATTQMVRDIAKQIDLTAVPTNRSIAPTAIAPTNEGIEQNITIHAEFPDAVNQKEIEEAFNNLFIRVSQYANRKD